ncbi:hypothetical protein ACFOUV_14480 [Oceanobacillus longus]|uniref:Uncharacterized protein n=1 Tax=Oceanobacillus longus TaxID=930120 RepID=A0ABV8GYP6_9BACI
MKSKWLIKLGAPVLALSLVAACGTGNEEDPVQEEEAPLNQEEENGGMNEDEGLMEENNEFDENKDNNGMNNGETNETPAE